MNMNKLINTFLLVNYIEALELLKNYNLSLFNSKNDIFSDIYIPLEINRKDLSIYTRQNKIKSKIKICNDYCTL